VLAALSVLAVILLGRALHGINPTTIALAFLLGVLGISTFWGLRPAVFMSVIATLAFNYFFLPRSARSGFPIRRTGSRSLPSWLPP